VKKVFSVQYAGSKPPFTGFLFVSMFSPLHSVAHVKKCLILYLVSVHTKAEAEVCMSFTLLPGL